MLKINWLNLKEKMVKRLLVSFYRRVVRRVYPRQNGVENTTL